MIINARDTTKLIATLQLALSSMYYMNQTEYMYPEQAEVYDGAIYDYIVVGGGTAGCVIARRLVEADFNVLLIDAGGVPGTNSNYPSLMLYLKDSLLSWNFTANGYGVLAESHKPMKDDLSQGIVLGGTSSLSYSMYTPGVRQDYNYWAHLVKDRRWSWENVLPYFKKSQRLNDEIIQNSPDGNNFGTTGRVGLTTARSSLDVTLLKAFEEMGNNIVPSLGGNRSFGYTETLLAIDDGLRQSTVNSYLMDIKDNPKLHVLRNTIVKRIIFDTCKRAIGVEAYTYDKRDIVVVVKKEVIVSAGVVNSPKLLMLSGIGPSLELHKHKIIPISDLPVGVNLKTHVLATIIHNITSMVYPYRPWNPHKFPASTLIGLYSYTNTSTYPACQSVSFANFPLLNMRYCVFTYGYNNTICDNLLSANVNSETIYSIVSLQKVKSRGSIRLKSRDFREQPLINFNFYSAKGDLTRHAKCVKQFLKIKNTPTFKNLKVEMKNPGLEGCGSMDVDSIKYLKCYTKAMANAEHHYTSTCAMGSVVDTQLRVYGVRNLRVADASIMPTPTAGGTLGSTIMIGEKAAEMIIDAAKTAEICI